MRKNGVRKDSLDRSSEMVARSFFKFAGGKRSLLPELLTHTEWWGKIRTYYEPFLGGGALFWALANEGRFKRAVLSDTNERLVRTYLAVQKNPKLVAKRLAKMPNKKKFFLEQRERDIDSGSDYDVAAWFLYLNRTCFNGLYRVNRAGKFNVPFGHYVNPRICDERLLEACSKALRKATVRVADFSKTIAKAGSEDFVYCDPPYFPRSGTEFTSYTTEKFGRDEHETLRDVIERAKHRGAYVLVSNSGGDEVEEMYRIGFTTQPVRGIRNIGATGDRRGKAPDLLIW